MKPITTAPHFCRTAFATAVLLAAMPAYPQSTMPTGGSAMPTVRPYGIEAFGRFRDTILAGDFTPKVALGAVMAKQPTTGVGAVADARGEITIYEGKLIVSYGKDGPHAEPNSDQAALLAVGNVAAWQSVTVEQDVAPEAIEPYLAATARAHGLDPEQAFPFQIRGTLAFYLMHVNVAPTGGPHGMGLPIAVTTLSRGDQIDGRVAGFYVSPDLVGIVTHGG